MASLKISPKHGANPCIPICAFCGEEKNEIALLGRLKGDAEAPMHAVIDYQPCEECLKNWSQGVALIRVTSKKPQKNAVPLQVNDGEELFPTAQYIVLTPEAVKRMFDMDAENGSRILIEDAAFDNIIAESKEAGTLDEKGNVVK